MRPGLHWPNVDGGAGPDLSARKLVEDGGFAGGVMLTTANTDDARWLKGRGGRVVYRIYEAPGALLAAPSLVAQRHAAFIAAVDPSGYYQLLNEPDREYAAMGPAEFAQWWDTCAGYLLSVFPGLRLGFPAPSIDTDASYLAECFRVGGLRHAAFIAERGYWHAGSDAYADRWGMRWKRSLPYRMPIFVCEFGCTDATLGKVWKARGYLDYCASLPRSVALAAAFIGAGGDPAFDTVAAGRLWVDELMARAVGQSEGERAVSVEQVMTYRDLIVTNARSNGLKPSIVAGLIDVESGGNPDATSADNGPGLGHALGLMQVLEGEFSAGEDGHDPSTNLSVGCALLRAKLARYGGRLESGLAAYFGAVDSAGNPTDATDLTGTSGKKYVALVEASAARFVGLDALEAGPVADADFRQYAPKTGTWREVAVNLKGVADDALSAGRGSVKLAQQIVSGWGTR